MMNAGKYSHKIRIVLPTYSQDSAGFQSETRALVLAAYAFIKTTRGSTIIRNGTDFKRAYTNFTIRFPHTEITDKMLVEYRDKTYTIEYLNNVDEAGVELEMQCKAVTR